MTDRQVSDGTLAWSGAHLNVDNASGARMLTIGRDPDGRVAIVRRGQLDFPGGNTVLLSAEDGARLAGFLTGQWDRSAAGQEMHQ